ncbi:hypothetical protein ACRARG_06520 [Pseudooceanicola sp. C21-150M6]|uniref:hypothetical protein n=1 Tax=Pseudooceanicola sp. C21-150M6 TaxID=3434355 RepID=UPI003D7F25B6
MKQMRLGLSALALAGLAACQPAVPDSGAGVGFGDYAEYQRQREAQLAGQNNGMAIPAAPVVSAQPLDATGSTFPGTTSSDDTGDSAEDIAAETRAALGQAEVNSGVTPLNASPSNPEPAPVVVNNIGISNENDFDAVGEQRSIADDKALIAQNRANYTQVQPSALPTRTDTGPNIVAYALQTSHNPGQAQYRRTSLLGNRSGANCAKFPSPDLAQTEFLKSGGPERDRKGLDPDGDGFACTWDPRPFRKAAGG